MITIKTYNGQPTEHLRIDDLLEDQIRFNRLNSTKFEQHLARINKGNKRRISNNHADRLAKFKGNN